MLSQERWRPLDGQKGNVGGKPAANGEVKSAFPTRKLAPACQGAHPLHSMLVTRFFLVI